MYKLDEIKSAFDLAAFLYPERVWLPDRSNPEHCYTLTEFRYGAPFRVYIVDEHEGFNQFVSTYYTVTASACGTLSNISEDEDNVRFIYDAEDLLQSLNCEFGSDWYPRAIAQAAHTNYPSLCPLAQN